MPLAPSPHFLSRLTGLGLALGTTTAFLWALGSEAAQQHKQLVQARFQRSTVIAQSCGLQPAHNPRS